MLQLRLLVGGKRLARYRLRTRVGVVTGQPGRSRGTGSRGARSHEARG